MMENFISQPYYIFIKDTLPVIFTVVGLIIAGKGLATWKKSEDYKFELLKKEQATKVAELLAYWIKCDDSVLDTFTNEQRREHCEKLNRLTWELAIWVPDENLVRDIMNMFSHESNQDPKEIIFNIREQVQGSNNKKLRWQDIIYFK